MTPGSALISVSDKTGVVELARALSRHGARILSTGGTAKALREAGLEVVDVSEYTGFPEILDGRVKTLHPRVHAGLLARTDLEEHQETLTRLEIPTIDFVVVNLYPFERTIARSGVSFEEAVEQIDIGGPSMIRSAAKNADRVTVVLDPSDYEMVIDELDRDGQVSTATRRALSAKAFAVTAAYDTAIADYLAAQRKEPLREPFSLAGRERMSLRYGENPHQRAAFYTCPADRGPTVGAARQRSGKELSYNNILDLDAALELVLEFDEPATAVIKHTNPCGCATAETLAAATSRAFEGDPVSAYGSILAVNRPLDADTVDILTAEGRFLEAIIGPAIADDLHEQLTSRRKWGRNLRVLEMPTWERDDTQTRWQIRRLSGGFLVQERDDGGRETPLWKVVTSTRPDAETHAALSFAWKVVKHVKSNAIVLCRGTELIGAGAGQMSRVDSVGIAISKAGDRVTGSVLASDAFFPFRDGVDRAAESGVKAIIQPGGSIRDDDVIAACNEHGIAMIVTGERHFRH
ncbi:MAG: bifunctional phosphoribosylaminoimidazolecarboxamide formyltransferase/IMP cyclohydrolase [Planctomycetota bacterium]